MQFTTGNLLASQAEALVNTVNTVGIMGKGIALQFKEAFPNNFKVYKEACKNNELTIGKLLVVKDKNLDGEKIIINFPTKVDWKQKSKIEYIEIGLQELVRVIADYSIKSIALPPLGCGNGGLDWQIVKPLIISYLGKLQGVTVSVYEPDDTIKTVLQQETRLNKAKLTPARAMLLYVMFHYEIIGEDISLFATNKLAYFLQRLGENLKLNFVASHYGPYTVQVQHVLYNLNGNYLFGLEQNSAKAFEHLQLNYDKFGEVQQYVNENLNDAQMTRLKKLLSFVSGFESALSLEVLASIDFISQDTNLSLIEVTQKLHEWSDRKKKLFLSYQIKVAYEHLKAYKEQLSIV